ncbi:hypothetical protein [Methylobacterium oryzisoli]|uniref:hypothetical protein n=1 Tax=Methylobacterium oryzisoli TaxID=3385502 RepID=UPI0038924CED
MDVDEFNSALSMLEKEFKYHLLEFWLSDGRTITGLHMAMNKTGLIRVEGGRPSGPMFFHAHGVIAIQPVIET